MEFEYKRVKEKVDSLQKEKDVCTFLANGTQMYSCSVFFKRANCFIFVFVAAYEDRKRLVEGDY